MCFQVLTSLRSRNCDLLVHRSSSERGGNTDGSSRSLTTAKSKQAMIAVSFEKRDENYKDLVTNEWLKPISIRGMLSP